VKLGTKLLQKVFDEGNIPLIPLVTCVYELALNHVVVVSTGMVILSPLPLSN